jgi:hypothetical protein
MYQVFLFSEKSLLKNLVIISLPIINFNEYGFYIKFSKQITI